MSAEPASNAPWRLWIRGALRRPARGATVVLGLIALTTCSVTALVAADSLETLFIADARAEWGVVDVEVTNVAAATFGEGLAHVIGADTQQESGPWAPRLILRAVAVSGSGSEPGVQVLGLSAQEELFGPLPAGDGATDLVDLGLDGAIVNQRLARRLDLEVGDGLRLVVAVPQVELRTRGTRVEQREPTAVRWHVTVAGIASDAGSADLGRRANVLVRLDALQRVADLPGQVNVVHAAALAGDADGEDLVEAWQREGGRLGLTALAVKERALDVARGEGGLFRGILLTLALLVGAASIAVTRNLLAVLGEERARELALLRCLGVRRAVVTQLLTVEGAVYAAVAAVVGAAVAVPLGGLLAQRLADHFASISTGRGREQVALALDARPVTIAVATVVVAVVAVLTVRSVARRVAQLDPSDALRGVRPRATSAPPLGTRRPFVTWSVALLLLGAGLTGGDGAALLLFLGLTLALAAWWLLARRPAARRVAIDRRAAVAGLVWSVVAPALLVDPGAGLQAGFGVIALAGAAAVTCTTILVSAHLRGAMRFVRGYLPHGRLQAALRTAGAYAEHHRARSATIIGTVAIVQFMVVALAVLGSANDVPPSRQAGGFDVIATSVAPVDDDDVEGRGGAEEAVTLAATTIAETAFTVEHDDGSASLTHPPRLVAATSELAAAQEYGLARALPEYATAADALVAVAGSTDLAVVDRYAWPEGTAPGDTAVIDAGRGPRAFEIIAVLDTFVLDAVFVGERAYADLVPTSGPTFVLAEAREGTTPEHLAAVLEQRGRRLGLTAVTVVQAAEEVVRINRTFTDVFAMLLQAGLAVALVAVGALVARSVRERRSDIATLRALGFRRRSVRLLVVAEPTLLALLGVAIGSAVGLGILWLLFLLAFSDLAFVVAWDRVVVMSAGVLLLALAAAAPPARSAVRRDVGEAIRDLG